jgi:CheY-like chemotaxis protein
VNANILIVDDDRDILATMRLVLECAGYHVSTANNGAEALAQLRSEPAPCVIFLDLMMPVMDGWEFRAEQLQDRRLAAIPVIIMTGASKSVARASSAEAAGLLEKPVALDALLSTAGHYCKTTAPAPA